MASKSQAPAGKIYMDEAYVEVENEKFPIDNMLMKSASEELATANHSYEAIQFHGQKLRPVDFKSMASKSPASMSHESDVYEDIVFDDAASPIDHKPMSVKLEWPSSYDKTLPTENPMSFHVKTTQQQGHQETTHEAWRPSQMEKEPSAYAGQNRPKGIDKLPSSDTKKAGTCAVEDQESSEQSTDNNDPAYAEVSSDLIGKDVDEICDIMDSLQLSDFKEDIESNQIDGEYLWILKRMIS